MYVFNHVFSHKNGGIVQTLSLLLTGTQPQNMQIKRQLHKNLNGRQLRIYL